MSLLNIFLFKSEDVSLIESFMLFLWVVADIRSVKVLQDVYKHVMQCSLWSSVSVINYYSMNREMALVITLSSRYGKYVFMKLILILTAYFRFLA